MNKNEILQIAAKEIVSFVKSEAGNAIAGLTADDLKPIVMAQLNVIIEPLEKEAETTKSWWVRVRNRIYIRVINNAVDNAIATLNDGLKELTTTTK